jgi:hypothetical protein
MSEPSGTDPFDRLRDADPVRAHDVPDASLARVSARIQEHIMTDVQNNPASKRSRRPLALLGGLALVGGLAFAVAVVPGLGRQQPDTIASVPTQSPDVPTQSPDAPAPSSDPGSGGGMASCMMYDPATLPTFEVVFDGTVTAVDGDEITFAVNTPWKGVGDTVTLTAPSTSVALVGPVPDFEVGGRYLVTAAGTDINACGYTLDHDAATAATWAAAFAN